MYAVGMELLETAGLQTTQLQRASTLRSQLQAAEARKFEHHSPALCVAPLASGFWIRLLSMLFTKDAFALFPVPFKYFSSDTNLKITSRYMSMMIIEALFSIVCSVGQCGI